jgi:hypothetical protein
MQASTATGRASEQDVGPQDRLARLMEVVEHVSHLLPEQGPITVFIHHNTLHAFEDLPFHQGVAKGAHVFGCQPYLAEERYRDELRRGRIRFSDLQEALEQDLNGQADRQMPCFGSRIALRLAMLQYPLLSGPTEELVWYVAETDALRRVRREVSSAARGRLISETRRWVVRDLRGGYEAGQNGTSNGRPRPDRPISDGLAELLRRFGISRMESWTEDDWESFTLQALWRVCCDGVRDLPSVPPQRPYGMRHRDMLLEATGVDTDALVNEALIRFCSAFLDQGMAPWSLPKRDEGCYRAFCSLYRDQAPSGRWTRGLARELSRLEDQGISALESIAESLDALGVTEREREEYLSSTLLALRGWAGMVRQIEQRADRAVHPVPAGSLSEFLAVRLLLDRFALAYTAEAELGITTPVASFWRLARVRSDAMEPPSVEQRAFAVFQLAQVQGLSPDVLYRLGREGWQTVVGELEAFTDLERRRIFQMAYERRFACQFLDAVALHAPKTAGRPPAPRFQAMFCLDEREESFRRHLEVMAPDVETFGAAGFYSIAMYYRGAGDAHFTPLCPVVIRPAHWVTEEVGNGLDKSSRRRAMTRRVLGTASHQFHIGSRSFAIGAILTGVLGVLASVPLVARILFPRLTARVRQVFGRFVQLPPETHLHLEREDPDPGPGNGHVGLTVEEMSNNAERLLRDIGLTTGFARLVLLHGHGSNSLNNPYNSAYNCGACGGSAGGPNARAMARMLNDPRVRETLADRGLMIPETTVFVGGYHNTCDDSVVYSDVALIPPSHLAEYREARDLIQKVCDRNAHERCRRFMSAPLTLSFAAARQHVEGRAEDLAQTRPELGHATNAITIVGRREWSRGLFLDRRAFLTSYDPREDDADCSILTRILGAVFPVCSGINLEYYFSNVDNTGFGSGTKLPHNLAALLGVMDGAASDLRTGLPWQMVEIHEPVRSLFLIETTPESMTRIMDRNPGIGRLCRNEWIQLAVIEPESLAIHVYRDGTFVPYLPQSTVLPQAATSVDWYRGWRDHLEFAEIGA